MLVSEAESKQTMKGSFWLRFRLLAPLVLVMYMAQITIFVPRITHVPCPSEDNCQSHSLKSDETPLKHLTNNSPANTSTSSRSQANILEKPNSANAYLTTEMPELNLMGNISLSESNQYMTSEKTIQVLPISTSSLNRVFTCGWEYAKLSRGLFPEYSFEGTITTSNATPASDDILVFGKFGPCKGYEYETFPGRIVFVSGEAGRRWDNSVSPPNQYILGPLRDDGVRSIRVYWLVAIFISWYPPSFWPQIFDATMRPQSNLEYKAVIYATSNCVDFRQRAAKDIGKIIPVFFGGKCVVQSLLSSGNGTIYQGKDLETRDSYLSNLRAFSKFQFCLVLENQNNDGYISEKILNAFLGGCLPIYYGTNEVFDLFHPESFVFYDINNAGPALRLLEHLYNNKTAYRERMQRPILRNGNETIEKFFSLTDELGGGALKRRVRKMLGLET